MNPLGQTFRSALAAECPLQIAGAINAYAAMLAERAGFKALYVSGAGVANAGFGWPDLGFTTREQVAEEVRRIAAATPLPVLVDVDTGGDGAGDDRGRGGGHADGGPGGPQALRAPAQ